jgi:hypothetical protein
MYLRHHIAMQLASEHIDALRESAARTRARGEHRLAIPRLRPIRRRPIPTPAPPTPR